MSVYALSDIHGNGILWKKIKAYLQPEDKLFFLGDAIDRGPDGYEIMKDMIADSRITYLKGNHELLMQNGLTEYKNTESRRGEDFELWCYWNGGNPTFESWLASGSWFEWINILKKLPTTAIYHNSEDRTIFLTHAGFTPGTDPSDFDLVWDRDHFFDTIPEEWATGEFVVVHGHTPTGHLMKDFNNLQAWNGSGQYQTKNGAIVYADGVKIDIDCGCFYTHYTVLLNLDTWETIPFNEV